MPSHVPDDHRARFDDPVRAGAGRPPASRTTDDALADLERHLARTARCLDALIEDFRPRVPWSPVRSARLGPPKDQRDPEA